MYDDEYRGGWRVGDSDGVIHLCPECRDLMYEVAACDRDAVRRAQTMNPPEWVAAMTWLDGHCGGRQAVLTLDARPLAGPLPVPPDLDPAVAEPFGLIVGLLDRASERFFDGEDGEIRLALRRALVIVAERRPALLITERPVRLALGLIWAIGKANGLLHPQGRWEERTVREFLGSDAPSGPVGRKVQAAIRGPFAWTSDTRGLRDWDRATAALLPIGDHRLLTARTRTSLLQVRERALQAASTEPWPTQEDDADETGSAESVEDEPQLALLTRA